MGKYRLTVKDFLKTAVGAMLFGIGFNLFLMPNGLNAGGISGLAMILVRLCGFGSVGMITAAINLPLFFLAASKIGRKFLIGSLLGMLFSSVAIDAFSVLPHPNTEPLLGALYGGTLCGLGLGLVFSCGASTGGSDIIVRLIKKKKPDLAIGAISTCFDFAIAVLTGIVFRDANRTLYSGVAIFITGRIIDAVVYRFDYSRVALIISRDYEIIAKEISESLSRGVTYLNGAGYYNRTNTKVILTAVKRQQLAELKSLVAGIDPNAFVIVQEAHQVLGDGFTRYSKDTL